MTNFNTIENKVTQQNGKNLAQPSVFNFNSLNVHVVADDRGEPLFLANDVCAILGYLNPRTALKNHCREAGVLKQDISSGGQMREATFINEGNLYRLIIKSRKPEAEAFEIKVMEEILPSIRKTGEYRTPYSVNPNDKLTASQAEQLRVVLKGHCDKLPKDKQATFMTKGWSKLKSHFGCTYREIPQREFSEALSLVTRHTTEWELLDAPKPTTQPVELKDFFRNGNFYLSQQNGNLVLNPVPHGAILATVKEFIAMVRNPSNSPFSFADVIDIDSACKERWLDKLSSFSEENLRLKAAML